MDDVVNALAAAELEESAKGVDDVVEALAAAEALDEAGDDDVVDDDGDALDEVLGAADNVEDIMLENVHGKYSGTIT